MTSIASLYRIQVADVNGAPLIAPFVVRAQSGDQVVTVTDVPAGARLARVVAFDSGGAYVGYADITVTVGANNVAYVDLSSLTPGAPPPLGLQQPLSSLVSFQGPVAVACTGLINDVVVGDFDEDGIPDIVAAHQLSVGSMPPLPGGLTFFRGNVDGTFSYGQELPYGSTPIADPGLVAVDVNGDGHLDIVKNQVDRLAVLVNNGRGGFTAGQEFTVGANLVIRRVRAADLNGDGAPDLVVLAEGNEIDAVAFVNDGSGHFSTSAIMPTQFDWSGYFALALADMDGDGRKDLVAAGTKGQTSQAFYVARGLGNGSFAPFVVGNEELLFTAMDGQDFGATVCVADFNHDGVPDVCFGDRVFLGRGGLTYEKTFSFRAGMDGVVSAVTDLDGNGTLDLIVSASSLDARTTWLLPGLGDGTFGAAVPYLTGAVSVTIAARLATGPAAVMGGARSSSVSVFPLAGGLLQMAPSWSLPSTFSPVMCAPADVNQDGRPDLVFASSSGVLGLQSRAGGGYETTSVVDLSQVPDLPGYAPGTTCMPALADVDADGTPDLVLAYTQAGGGQQWLVVWKGHPDGTFTNPRPLAAAGAWGAVQVSDVNGDGKPDLVALDTGAHGLVFLQGDGAGNFSRASTTNLATPPYESGTASILALDFNVDGAPDLAVVDEGNVLHVLAGNGSGAFSERTTLSGVGVVATADANGDGTPDLFVGGSDLCVYLGAGNGTFAPVQRIALGVSGGVTNWISSLAVGDVNGDDRADVAYTTTVEPSVSVLLGVGDGQFERGATLSTGYHPGFACMRDLNQDGRLDLVVASDYSSGILQAPRAVTVFYQRP